jgi:poly-beta-hydroxyalkanoate depolymerase
MTAEEYEYRLSRFEKYIAETSEQDQKIRVVSLSGHSSAFLSTVATCLCAVFAVVNVMVLTLFGTSVANIST